MAKIATEAVELSNDKNIALPQCLETGHQPRAIITFTGGLVLVNPCGGDTSLEQRIALKIQNLAAIGLRYAGVSYQHRRFTNGRLGYSDVAWQRKPENRFKLGLIIFA